MPSRSQIDHKVASRCGDCSEDFGKIQKVSGAIILADRNRDGATSNWWIDGISFDPTEEIFSLEGSLTILFPFYFVKKCSYRIGTNYKIANDRFSHSCTRSYVATWNWTCSMMIFAVVHQILHNTCSIYIFAQSENLIGQIYAKKAQLMQILRDKVSKHCSEHSVSPINPTTNHKSTFLINFEAHNTSKTGNLLIRSDKYAPVSGWGVRRAILEGCRRLGELSTTGRVTPLHCTINSSAHQSPNSCGESHLIQRRQRLWFCRGKKRRPIKRDKVTGFNPAFCWH